MQLPHAVDSDKLWFGRHAVDGDTLVLDPSQSTPDSSTVTLFSLTQFRPRRFPPSIVRSQIREIVDPQERVQAEEQYREWPTLKAEREQERERTSQEVAARQKERIVEAHKRFLDEQNLPYQGVQDSSEESTGTSRKRQRTACQRCGIPLDDFVQTRCAGCNSVLCSCGACGCRAPAAPRAS